MTRNIRVRGIAMVSCLLGGSIVLGQYRPITPVVLTVRMDRPVSNVSPILYGAMTEEINHSYDGGLYAEMIRNRTFFANWEGVLHWILVEDGDAQAKIGIDQGTGPSDALKSSLRLDVTQADATNQAGLLNEGYWGMPLEPNTVYKGSLYAKADSDSIPAIMLKLVSNGSGKTVASTLVPGLTTSWKQFSFCLKTGAIVASSGNHLVLTVGHAGTLWLNLVSLFPPTFHDRVNGNRIDLMEKLAAMHPAFLRFPGGNYLEGDHIAERYPWRKTIGALVDRETHPSPWGYLSSDGLGLLEFLEWCEDLRMQPVLAVYAGYSLAQEHVSAGADLDPYVQDALDELEYVMGGTDTIWGAARAKDGHPNPFKLTYVEIGNEDYFDKSGTYDERYAQFYKSIKAMYPDLQLIATSAVKSVRPDVIDEHFYVRATDFFHDTTHYDKADRNGPKILVGEWATREGGPTPNFGAALGDAAWMTGMERNSDIILMAAYAPLLTNLNAEAMQWQPNLIGYDAQRSYGSPSYYAQVMFANHLGDKTLDTRLQGAGPKFFCSVTKDTSKKRLYVKLVNASSKPQPVEIHFEEGKLSNAGHVLTLAAKSTQATNTLDEPANVIPVQRELSPLGNNIRHTMPAFSIQVIQVDQQ
jgi:alpha-L-arabinofuranosidase